MVQMSARFYYWWPVRALFSSFLKTVFNFSLRAYSRRIERRDESSIRAKTLFATRFGFVTVTDLRRSEIGWSVADEKTFVRLKGTTWWCVKPGLSCRYILSQPSSKPCTAWSICASRSSTPWITLKNFRNLICQPTHLRHGILRISRRIQAGQSSQSATACASVFRLFESKKIQLQTKLLSRWHTLAGH